MSPEAAAHKVKVLIRPAHKSGLNGENLLFEVVVVNLGMVEDTLVLEVSDELGWDLSLSPTVLVVPPQDNQIALLVCSIPSYAVGGTKDNIRVKVTSMNNPSIQIVESCTASVTIYRDVKISIVPASKTGKPGDRLIYSTIISNLGNVEDLYVLEAVDNSGWDLKIPTSIAVAPWDNRILSLIVLIPRYALLHAANRIWVRVASQADPSVSDLASCEARVFYGWRSEVIDSANAGWYASLAVDEHRLYVSYYDVGERDLKYARWDGGWKIEIVDSEGDVGGWTSLELDSAGRPHISYYDFSNRRLKYARWTGSRWAIEVVDDAWEVGKFSSLALDSQDRPHIAYWDERNRHLKYATKLGGAWRVERVDAIGEVEMFCSLALDPEDGLHIVYYGDGYLKYATKKGNWIKRKIIAAEVSSGVSIAVDAKGQPHLVFFDLKNDSLIYAHLTAEGWVTETVDSGAGWLPSLALDNLDRPHLSYLTLSGKALKYARWDGLQWRIENISLARVCYTGPTSIALDASGWPHIAYLDYVDGRYVLKRAWIE